jgi:hypothetical protein
MSVRLLKIRDHSTLEFVPFGIFVNGSLRMEMKARNAIVQRIPGME